MKLYELAFACYTVPIFESGYQKTYEFFLGDTKPNFNMRDENHRKALLTWLNNWRCHIPGTSFEDISRKLLAWFEKYEGSFPEVERRLTSLPDEEIDRVEAVYNELQEITFIGDTVASKILFAIRSEVYPIWDRDMKAKYRKKGCSKYNEYMKCSKRELLDLNDDCQRNGITIAELPSLLGREQASLLKLLDEYHWVFIKQELKIPFSDQLQKWCKWASGNKQRT